VKLNEGAVFQNTHYKEIYSLQFTISDRC